MRGRALLQVLNILRDEENVDRAQKLTPLTPAQKRAVRPVDPGRKTSKSNN